MSKRVDTVYDRTHRGSSPEHARRVADYIRAHGRDVEVSQEGSRIRIQTTVYEGEDYRRDVADDKIEDLFRDLRPD